MKFWYTLYSRLICVLLEVIQDFYSNKSVRVSIKEKKFGKVQLKNSYAEHSWPYFWNIQLHDLSSKTLIKSFDSWSQNNKKITWRKN